MHDIRLIRDDPDAFDRGLAKRGLQPLASELVALDERRRGLITQLQDLQTRRNEASREFGALKSGRLPDKSKHAQGGIEQLTELVGAFASPFRLEALEKELAEIKLRIPQLESEERLV